MGLLIGAVLAAFVGAVVSAIAGLGGGTMLIAVLVVLGLSPQQAVPLHAVVQAVSNGTRVVAYRQHVRWRTLVPFMAGALPSPFLVGGLVRLASPDVLRLVLGTFVLLVTWTPIRRWLSVDRGPWAMPVAGVLAGAVGMFVGATGTIIGPFFLRRGWRKETVIGTEALCQGAAHVVKVAAAATWGLAPAAHLALAVPMMGAVVAGTFCGRAVLRRLDEQQFRRLFRGMLTGLAVWLLVRGAMGLGAA